MAIRLSSTARALPSSFYSAVRPQHHRFLHRTGAAAATSPIPPKKQITVRSNDTSTKPWAELSGGQKIVRTANTSFNGAVVVAGLLVTGGIATFLYLEVFALDSATAQFNRTHERIKKSERCRQLLGAGGIKAYGEPTSNRWARNRPIASSKTTDKNGVEHLRMHFNVEGDLNKGVVSLHMVRRPGEGEYTYRYLALDVPGKNRVYLENADMKAIADKGSGKGFLGVKWSR